MTLFERILPTLVPGVVIVFVALRALFQSRREEKAHKLDWERRMAELDRQRAERAAAQVAENRLETVRDGLIELYRAMNEYHIASGAGVLTAENFHRFVRAEVTVGV